MKTENYVPLERLSNRNIDEVFGILQFVDKTYSAEKCSTENLSRKFAKQKIIQFNLIYGIKMMLNWR